MIKAVSLISGGLDSMLATKAIMEQGIHVEGINFYTGFCVEGHTHAIRKHDKEKQKRNNALWVAEQLGIKLHIIDIVEAYKDIVINPKYGYGANINPCLDCKIFMVKQAKHWMEENGFDFVITGEVVGQRPMSQRKQTMPIVVKQSGIEERLVRPLSARNLPETLPEREGWIDREKLFGFSGRSRKPQIALAKEYDIEEYSQPAGGCCFLTNQAYTSKLQDLWQARGERRYELDDIMLLKVGRHIRPKSHFKLIIAREEGEFKYLEGYRHEFTHLFPTNKKGPIALIDGQCDSEEDLQLACKVLARFCKSDTDEIEITLKHINKPKVEKIAVLPFQPDDIPKDWYL